MVLASYPAGRPRRLRQSAQIRTLVAECSLSANDFVMPIFVRDDDVALSPLPYDAFHRYTLETLAAALHEAVALGIPAVMLFPVMSVNKKDDTGSEAFNPDNLLARAIRIAKLENLPLSIWVDVALDPYTVHGHDGVLVGGKIDNDLTLEKLTQLACIVAEAGADALCPSDMMDGRIAVIRAALDAAGHHEKMLVSYAAKYASSFYGPFRQAVGAAPLKGLSDKRTYQMDPCNVSEALKEATLDCAEGADMLIVKPGLPYLDVIAKVADASSIPVLAYHVSGEYMMIKAAAEKGYIDESAAFLESCIAFKRAGCRAIISYAAREVLAYLGD